MGANPASGVNYSFGRWKSSAVAVIRGGWAGHRAESRGFLDASGPPRSAPRSGRERRRPPPTRVRG